MFVPLTQSYVLGFTRNVNNPSAVLDITPDSDVVELFAKFTGGGVGANDWGFYRQVILTARRLFNNNLNLWLMSQSENTKLTENSRALLNDTVAFINTGTRPVSIGGRARVISREVAMQTPTGKGPIDTVTDKSINPLTQWLRRPNSMVDLIHTLNLLFGNGVGA